MGLVGFGSVVGSGSSVGGGAVVGGGGSVGPTLQSALAGQSQLEAFTLKWRPGGQSLCQNLPPEIRKKFSFHSAKLTRRAKPVTPRNSQ